MNYVASPLKSPSWSSFTSTSLSDADEEQSPPRWMWNGLGIKYYHLEWWVEMIFTTDPPMFMLVYRTLAMSITCFCLLLWVIAKLRISSIYSTNPIEFICEMSRGWSLCLATLSSILMFLLSGARVIKRQTMWKKFHDMHRNLGIGTIILPLLIFGLHHLYLGALCAGIAGVVIPISLASPSLDPLSRPIDRWIVLFTQLSDWLLCKGHPILLIDCFVLMLLMQLPFWVMIITLSEYERNKMILGKAVIGGLLCVFSGLLFAKIIYSIKRRWRKELTNNKI